MSRLTFREKSDICWQRQLRDSYSVEGSPPIKNLSLSQSIIKPISRKLAEQIILKYEWLGTMGAGVQRCYGIFWQVYCAGATALANAGAVPALMKTFGLSSTELSYLVRGACTHWAPSGTNSRLVAWTCKLERLAGFKLIVAFADTDAGEIGTIYQACNWAYIGMSSSWFQWVSPLGKIWSSNSATKRRSTQGGTMKDQEQLLVNAGWHKQWSNPKHRYVYVLDKTDKLLIDKVESMRKPYPKRASVVEKHNASPTSEEVAVQT